MYGGGPVGAYRAPRYSRKSKNPDSTTTYTQGHYQSGGSGHTLTYKCIKNGYWHYPDTSDCRIVAPADLKEKGPKDWDHIRSPGYHGMDANHCHDPAPPDCAPTDETAPSKSGISQSEIDAARAVLKKKDQTGPGGMEDADAFDMVVEGWAWLLANIDLVEWVLEIYTDPDDYEARNYVTDRISKDGIRVWGGNADFAGIQAAGERKTFHDYIWVDYLGDPVWMAWQELRTIILNLGTESSKNAGDIDAIQISVSAALLRALIYLAEIGARQDLRALGKCEITYRASNTFVWALSKRYHKRASTCANTGAKQGDCTFNSDYIHVNPDVGADDCWNDWLSKKVDVDSLSFVRGDIYWGFIDSTGKKAW